MGDSDCVGRSLTPRRARIRYAPLQSHPLAQNFALAARVPDSVRRSFLYPSADIDSHKLVILSRTSRNAHNQHDADLCTFHRAPNFRSLAMELWRRGLGSLRLVVAGLSSDCRELLRGSVTKPSSVVLGFSRCVQPEPLSYRTPMHASKAPPGRWQGR